MCRILRRVVALLILLQFTGNAVIGCEVKVHGLANSPRQSERVQEPARPVRSRQGVGQLVVEDAQSGAKFRLNLARYHVHVVMQPPVALVQIDQSFYNPLERQQEGTFVFNLPPSASVSRFAMYVTRTQLIEGELIERRRASNIYESIVRSMRDPAILEQIGDSLFKMRVFPIFAKDTKRILLDYTVPLVADAGRYRFQLPLMSDLEPIGDFRVTGVIHGPTDIESVAVTIDPPIDLVRERRPDGAVTFELAQRSVRPLSDLSVEFVQRSDQEITVQSYAPEPAAVGPDRRPNSPYFLATLWPGSVPGTDRVSDVKPVDMLILAETSARIRDRDGLRRTIQATVDKLRPEDRFQLGCVDVAWTLAIDRCATAGFRPAQTERRRH